MNYYYIFGYLFVSFLSYTCATFYEEKRKLLKESNKEYPPPQIWFLFWPILIIVIICIYAVAAPFDGIDILIKRLAKINVNKERVKKDELARLEVIKKQALKTRVSDHIKNYRAQKKEINANEQD